MIPGKGSVFWVLGRNQYYMQISKIANPSVMLPLLHIQGIWKIGAELLYLVEIHGIDRCSPTLIKIKCLYMSELVETGTYDESRVLTDVAIDALSFGSLPGDGIRIVVPYTLLVDTRWEHIPEHDRIPACERGKDIVLRERTRYDSEILSPKHAVYSRRYPRGVDPISGKHVSIGALLPIELTHKVLIWVAPDVGGALALVLHSYHGVWIYRELGEKLRFCYRRDTALQSVIVDEIRRRIRFTAEALGLGHMVELETEIDMAELSGELIFYREIGSKIVSHGCLSMSYIRQGWYAEEYTCEEDEISFHG